MAHRISRQRLAVCWLVVFGLFVTGVALMWDYLGREYRRMAPAQFALLWSSEAVSGLWFLRFGLRHVVAGEPLPKRPSHRERMIVIVTLGIGMLLDAGLTVYKHVEEAMARSRSVLVVARVLEGAKRSGFSPPAYHVRGDFSDAMGTVHKFDQVYHARTLPPETEAAVEGERLPAVLILQYDPDRPDRIWMDKEAPGDRLYVISLVALICQVLVLVPVIAPGGLKLPRSFRSVPPEQVGPFVIYTVVQFPVAFWRWWVCRDVF